MNNKFSLIPVISLAFLLLFSCGNQPPGTEIPVEIQEIGDVTITGEVVSSDEEVLALFNVVGGATATSMGVSLSQDTDVQQIMGNLSATPAPGAGKGVTDNFDYANYKGDITYSYDGIAMDPQGASKGAFTFDAYVSLDHDLAIENNFPVLPTATPGSASAEFSVDAGMAIENLVALEDESGTVTINKAALTIEVDASVDLSNFTVKLTPLSDSSNRVDIDTATLSYSLAYNVKYVLAVSSNHPNVKGGKIVVSTSFSNSLNSFDLGAWYGLIMENSNTNGGSPDVDFLTDKINDVAGDLSNIAFNVKVFDQNNTIGYDKILTAEELAALLSSNLNN